MKRLLIRILKEKNICIKILKVHILNSIKLMAIIITTDRNIYKRKYRKFFKKSNQLGGKGQQPKTTSRKNSK